MELLVCVLKTRRDLPGTWSMLQRSDLVGMESTRLRCGQESDLRGGSAFLQPFLPTGPEDSLCCEEVGPGLQGLRRLLPSSVHPQVRGWLFCECVEGARVLLLGCPHTCRAWRWRPRPGPVEKRAHGVFPTHHIRVQNPERNHGSEYRPGFPGHHEGPC